MKTTIEKIFCSLVIVCTLNFYVYSAKADPSNSPREVIEVSEKRHILADHMKGLDEFDNLVDYYIKEQWILRFKNRNGFFSVNKEVFDDAFIGKRYTTEDNNLYNCREQDACNNLL